MNTFNLALTKNFTKLTLITIASLSSTLGLRTEMAIIFGDIGLATWLAIGWVFVIIIVLAYYKSKQDVELISFREYEKNRVLAGFKPVSSYTYTGGVTALNQADDNIREK
jgi:hypothetical protein